MTRDLPLTEQRFEKQLRLEKLLDAFYADATEAVELLPCLLQRFKDVEEIEAAYDKLRLALEAYERQIAEPDDCDAWHLERALTEGD